MPLGRRVLTDQFIAPGDYPQQARPPLQHLKPFLQQPCLQHTGPLLGQHLP